MLFRSYSLLLAVATKYPISYADAYCVATAKSKELRIVTGDTEYEFIKDELPVEWLPKKNG